jgi:DNA-binding MarR family transcriptional regulator
VTTAERPPKLSDSQRRILNALYWGDLSTAQLGRILGVESRAVSAYMQALIRKGLVRKLDDTWRAV